MGQSNLKGQQAIKYYRDLKKTKTMAEEKGEELKKQIKLRARIDAAEEGASYELKVGTSSNYSNTLLTTSAQRCGISRDIDFPEFLIMEYYFEIEQPFHVQVTKNGYQYHSISTTLGTIFGSRNNTFVQKCSGGESISIISEPLSDIVEYIDIRLQGKLNSKDISNYHDKIYYLISTNTSKIYQSEPMSATGTFNRTDIPTNLLTPSFKFELFNSKHKSIFSITTNVPDFCNPSGAFKEINFEIKRGKLCTFTNTSKATKDYSFLDYIKAGVRLGLDIGIDFTGSNGHPLDPVSLHRVGPGIENDYEKAIKACGNIVAQYDYDQLFPVFGFGAKIRDEPEASMCFNITLTDNAYINGIAGVVEEYHKVLNNLTFFGPTFFAPIITQVISDIRHESNPFDYHILMILTDGVINDMNATIDALVEGAFLPLSVIIIGIGNADFSNMIILDADDDPLVDTKGRKCVRDLVQFVPFNQYRNNAKELAKQVLEEIPRQIVEYYGQNNIYPDSIN